MEDKHMSDLIPWPTGRKHPKVIDAASEQLAVLEGMLQKEGVETFRPEVMDWSKPIVMPEWSVPNQYTSVCPRDVMITFGNIMVEAPVSRRDRFLEYQAYQPLANKFWREDYNAMWKSCPKNSMNDSMYNVDWLDKTEEERAAKRETFEFCLKNDEIVFDAADFTRTGKHVFGQISMTTNKTAIEWLHRELEPHGFVVHPLHI
jgi:glycine amidinotransferase